MLRGSITALITPFADGAVDESARVRRLADPGREPRRGAGGDDGESPTVTHEEHRRIIEITVDVADRRVPVVAGAGSNSTGKAVSLTHALPRMLEPTRCCLSCPITTSRRRKGLFQHFSAVAQATSLPVILYSVPGRTVVDITVDTMARLRERMPTSRVSRTRRRAWRRRA